MKRCVVSANIQPHQTISRMAQGASEEVLVLSEEGDAAKPVQHGNNFRVFDSESGHVTADLPKRNTPSLQERELVFRKILVEKVQAAARAALFRAGLP